MFWVFLVKVFTPIMKHNGDDILGVKARKTKEHSEAVILAP